MRSDFVDCEFWFWSLRTRAARDEQVVFFPSLTFSTFLHSLLSLSLSLSFSPSLSLSHCPFILFFSVFPALLPSIWVIVCVCVCARVCVCVCVCVHACVCVCDPVKYSANPVIIPAFTGCWEVAND